MVWKWGCGIALFGTLLSLGSCFLFGTATSKGEKMRQVATRPIALDRESVLADIQVEPETAVRVDLRFQVALTAELVGAEPGNAQYHRLQVPVNYRVKDQSGAVVQLGAGHANCGIIETEVEGEDGRTQRRRQCDLQGKRFPAPNQGLLSVEVELPNTQLDGGRVVEASVEVFDRVPETIEKWAIGGCAAALGGPVLVGMGVLVWIIGLMIASGKKARENAL